MRTSPHDSTVFLVDDDDDMRNSLEWLLATLGLRVKSFATAEAFLQFWDVDHPGCLILDVRMPRMSGLELYQEVLNRGSRIPVIFMTAHADVPTAVQALKSGAIEFLEKPFDRPSLMKLVHQALQLDRRWRSRQQEYQEIHNKISQLTLREQETLAMIIQGEPNKTIALREGISERAVEMRRSSIMKKLQVRSLAELLEKAITHRMLSELKTASSYPPFSID